jgi:hypothetical protein
MWGMSALGFTLSERDYPFHPNHVDCWACRRNLQGFRLLHDASSPN